MKWHYVKHVVYRSYIYPQWIEWLSVTVGAGNWKYDYINEVWCMCFAKEEDATAFRLKFGI